MPANPFLAPSADYADARPGYPPALFAALAALAPARGRAWDVATGSGQAALGLAPLFAEVLATDASEAQLAQARPAPNVRYERAPAEAAGLPDAHVDLVTVAQALHWFDLDRFWPEVRRVLRPGGVFAAWGYAWPEVPPALDAALVAPFRALVDPWWSPGNRLVWNGYDPATFRFPFATIPMAPMRLELRWTVGTLARYLRTWSAYQRGEAEIAARAEALFAAGRAAAEGPVPVSMPLTMLVGRRD